MPPSPYLLWVNSRPTHVSPSLWKKWYRQEHLSETIHSGMSTRATFYEEVALPCGGDDAGLPKHSLPFLALYQTDLEEAMASGNCASHRSTSALFEREGGPEAIVENGVFEVRNYGLVETFDPNGRGEVPPDYIMTVEMCPQDPDDFNRWYSEEHLPLVVRIPGYLRTLRYRIGPLTPVTEEDVPTYLTVHEMEDLGGFASEEAKQSIETAWTKKQMAESRVFVSRGWRLVYSEGF